MNNELFSIYGARRSKDEKRVNISLVRGEDKTREWATVSLLIDGSKSKTKVAIKDGYAFVKIPLIVPTKKESAEPIF